LTHPSHLGPATSNPPLQKSRTDRFYMDGEPQAGASLKDRAHQRAEQLTRSLPLSKRTEALLVLLFTVFGAAMIISTYPVYNHTMDETQHIASGMELLVKGTYSRETSHPPIGRVAAAIGPFLAGVQSTPAPEDTLRYGEDILQTGGMYFRNLTLARLGMLLFYFMAAAVVWYWSRVLFGVPSALFSVALFTTLPPVIAHAGLATTDMPGAAALVGALLAITLWLDEPNGKRSIVLGLAIGFALGTKLSNPIYLVVSTLPVALSRSSRRDANRGDRRLTGKTWLKSSATVAITAILTLWASYAFSFRPICKISERPHAAIDQIFGVSSLPARFAYFIAERAPVPAPEFFLGLGHLARFKEGSAPVYYANYIFGTMSPGVGRWYFFPVAFAVKSPIPFLLATGLALPFLFRRRRRAVLIQSVEADHAPLPIVQNAEPKNSGDLDWPVLLPLFFSLVVFAVGMAGNINIGVRHVLSVYPLLAITAGAGATALWNTGRFQKLGRMLVVTLPLCQLIICLKGRPDFLPYFNPLAGEHPEEILVDSDLDWGQDLHRLSEELRGRKVPAVSIAYFGTADVTRHGLPSPRYLDPNRPVSGWIAVSISMLKLDPRLSWLDGFQPVTVVGRSIRLYHLTEQQAARAALPLLSNAYATGTPEAFL